MKTAATLPRFVFLFSLALACPLTCPAQASLVAHWTFDETGGSIAADSFGSFDGTLMGSSSFVAGGVSGNALSLVAAGNSYVDMGSSVPGFTTGDFSIVAWIKTTATNGDAIFAGKHLSGNTSGYFLGVNAIGGSGGAADKAAFYPTGTGNNIPFSSTTVNDNAWHQIVGVYTAGGNALIYVDGGVAEDSKASVAMAGNAAAFLIGGITIGSSPTNQFEGLVDDVQLYGSALTQSEVAYLFSNPGKAVPEPGALFLALLGSLPLTLRRRVGR